jgi:hypothetical protein
MHNLFQLMWNTVETFESNVKHSHPFETYMPLMRKYLLPVETYVKHAYPYSNLYETIVKYPQTFPNLYKNDLLFDAQHVKYPPSILN